MYMSCSTMYVWYDYSNIPMITVLLKIPKNFIMNNESTCKDINTTNTLKQDWDGTLATN